MLMGSNLSSEPVVLDGPDKALVAHAKNAGKPGAESGKILLERMNSSHQEMALWALGALDLSQPIVDALDIGCGGGQNIKNILGLAPDAHVHGVDHSEVALSLAREVLADEIAADQVELHEASVLSMPFADESFDLVLACETIYFWPEIDKAFVEVKRVLRPGGRFLIICEDGYPGKGFSEYVYVRSLEEIEALVQQAGFMSFCGLRHRPDRWIAGVAVKALG